MNSLPRTHLHRRKGFSSSRRRIRSRNNSARTAENDRALFDLLKNIVADLLVDGELSGVLKEWFQDEFAPYKSEHEFRNWGEYWNYIRQHDIRSLKGEKVKSYEECEIANFLYLNGVTYEYEAPYKHDTATSEKRQYQPDFFFPITASTSSTSGSMPRGRPRRSSTGKNIAVTWSGSAKSMPNMAPSWSRHSAMNAWKAS